MSARNFILLGILLSFFLAIDPVRAEDDRTAVSLPADVKDTFLGEMRGHMGNLDDILFALTEGNFNEAADIAEIHMDFGHSMWAGMLEKGMSPKKVLEMKEVMRGKGMGMGMGQGRQQGQGMGKGMGRYMPEDFRAMGGAFHDAAANFAIHARAAATPPTVNDYKDTISALQEVTAICQSCHETYRVE